METEILKELAAIRAYVFIMMSTVIIWVIFKTFVSSVNLYVKLKTAIDTVFGNRMDELLDLGGYEEIIKDCEEKLQKYPNHPDALWFIAKAYYFTENNELSKKYFEKAIYISPNWEESAEKYLEKLNEKLTK